MKKKKRTAYRTEPVDTRGMGHLLFSALKGTFFAACLGALLLLIVTAVVLSGDDPTSLVRPMGYAISALIAFGAGLITVRLHGRRVLLCGLFAAVLVFMIYTALSFLPAMSVPSSLSGGLSAAIHGAAAALSLLGAYLGRRRS